MTDLVDRLRGIIDQHRPAGGAGSACDCGADDLPDHSRHLAEEIAHGLELRRERLDEADEQFHQQIRYVSAWFDDELTKLEGAE